MGGESFYGDPNERYFPIGPTRENLVKQVHALTEKVGQLEERIEELEGEGE